MFDVGFQEITLIGVIALIVVGPERLPKMARTLGLWMGKIRFYVNQVKSDIDREVRAQELKEMLDKPSRELQDVYKVAEETKDALGEAKGALGDAKASLDSAAFDASKPDASKPDEPAAGSILPPKPPEPEAAPVTKAKSEPEGKPEPEATPETEGKPEPTGTPVTDGTSAAEAESAKVGATPEEPPASVEAPPADAPGNVRDEPNDHERTAASASADDDNERTSGRV